MPLQLLSQIEGPQALVDLDNWPHRIPEQRWVHLASDLIEPYVPKPPHGNVGKAPKRTMPKAKKRRKRGSQKPISQTSSTLQKAVRRSQWAAGKRERKVAQLNASPYA